MKKLLLIIFLLGAGIFAYMLFFKPPERTQEITQRSFEQMVDAGEVSEICILDDRRVSVVLNEKGQNLHGKSQEQPHYTFSIITRQSFEDDLSKLDTGRIKIHKGLPSIGAGRFIVK